MSYSTNKPNLISVPWLAMVVKFDPEWSKGRVRELQYDYPAPGRYFYADPYHSGPYAGDFDYRDFATGDFNTQATNK